MKREPEKTLMDKYLEDPQFAKLMAQGELIMEVTETLCKLLENEKISRKELADRLGKTKGFVSQLLNGGRNLTLRTLADILHAMGYKLTLKTYKEGMQPQEDSICEIPTWHTRFKIPGVTWRPGEIAFPENYPFDLAISQ